MVGEERKEVSKKRGRCVSLLANRRQIYANMRRGSDPELK